MSQSRLLDILQKTKRATEKTESYTYKKRFVNTFYIIGHELGGHEVCRKKPELPVLMGNEDAS